MGYRDSPNSLFVNDKTVSESPFEDVVVKDRDVEKL